MAFTDGAARQEAGTAFAIYKPRSTRIEPLMGFADVYLTEDHERRVTKTKYPIESGASLTDHAVREPDRLTIQGFTSHLQPSSPALRNQPDRPALAWAEIDRLMNARELVEVATILAIYTDMLITRAKAPVSNTTGRDLLFTLELEEVQTERLDTIAIEPAPDGPAVGRSVDVSRGNEQAADILDLLGSGGIGTGGRGTGDTLASTPDPFGDFDLGARFGEVGESVGGFFDQAGTVLNDFFSGVLSSPGGSGLEGLDFGGVGQAGGEIFETTGGVVEDVTGIIGTFFDQLGTKINGLSGDAE